MDFSREFGLASQVIEKDYTLGWNAHIVGRNLEEKRIAQR